MRAQWILLIFPILVSMGLLVIITGQYQMLVKHEDVNEKVQKQLKQLAHQHENENFFKGSLERVLANAKKAEEDLKATVAKLSTEIEKKKTENDACQGEKKTKNDEVAASEKAQTDTQDTVKSESEAWKQEIDNLKAQMTGRSPICDHVKKDPLAWKLCGITATESTLTVKA